MGHRALAWRHLVSTLHVFKPHFTENSQKRLWYIYSASGVLQSCTRISTLRLRREHGSVVWPPAPLLGLEHTRGEVADRGTRFRSVPWAAERRRQRAGRLSESSAREPLHRREHLRTKGRRARERAGPTQGGARAGPAQRDERPTQPCAGTEAARGGGGPSASA